MSRSLRIPTLSALTRCLQEEPSAIAAAAGRLSSDEVEEALGLLERCADRWPYLTAADLITSDPITVDGDLLVMKALEPIEHKRRHQPISVPSVVDQDQQVIGLLRLHDLVHPGLA
tara:strand:- start:1405 stop:1752 length:348 start_codon:yes stop_codon:yes gene_type:complete